MLKSKGFKIALIAVCLSILLGFAYGCVYYIRIYNRIVPILVISEYATYSTIDNLTESSDLIIVASPIETVKDRKNINNWVTDSQGDRQLDYFQTLTKVKVEKVIKTDDPKIAPNEVIEVSEPFTIVQEIDGKKLLQSDGYEPIGKDSRYLIFLQKNESTGYYFVMQMNDGRFDLEDDPIKDERHNKFRNEAMEKFKDKLN